MSQPAVLSVKNLTVAFGDKQVVKDLSFEIAAGSTLAVVGESGSGKSVTSLAIMGLLPEGNVRASGSIQLNQRELLSLREHEMCGIRGGTISMIFQEPMTSLNPVQKVGFQVGEAIRIHRGLRGQELKTQSSKCSERSEFRIRKADRQLSAHVLRWDAAACHDRDGARVQSRADHSR